MAIRAPIGGTVTERAITNGQFVGSDSTALMTIADFSTVWVQADIFERDIHSIAAGQKADVTTAAYPERPLQRAGRAHRHRRRRADAHRRRCGSSSPIPGFASSRACSPKRRIELPEVACRR